MNWGSSLAPSRSAKNQYYQLSPVAKCMLWSIFRTLLTLISQFFSLSITKTICTWFTSNLRCGLSTRCGHTWCCHSNFNYPFTCKLQIVMMVTCYFWISSSGIQGSCIPCVLVISLLLNFNVRWCTPLGGLCLLAGSNTMHKYICLWPLTYIELTNKLAGHKLINWWCEFG